MNSESGTLTRYAPGSVKEIWTLSWPMILSAAASNLLIFGDRVVLSYYSADAFNANVAATPWCWAFVFVFIAYTGVAEVFVGRYNGSRQYWRIGPVVWQMVFFSFALYAVLFPIVEYVTQYMIAEKLANPGIKYLNVSLLGLPIGVAAWGALASFFVGLGKTKIVFVITVICNIVNIILDVVLVFGWKFIPSYGCVGAAYATFMTQIVTFSIFLVVFLRKNYAKKYHTREWKFDFHYIKKCLEIGTPHATSAFFNCFAAAIFWQFIADYVSVDDFTGFGIDQAFFVVLYFFVDGLGKGIGAASANYMGAHELDNVTRSIVSTIKLFAISIVIAFMFMCVYSEFFIKLCFPTASNEVVAYAVDGLFWVWFLFCTEGLWLLMVSVLVSAGDTKFTMKTNILAYMFVGLIPCSILLFKFGKTSSIYWKVFAVEMGVRSIVFIWRYRSKKWMNNKIFQMSAHE